MDDLGAQIEFEFVDKAPAERKLDAKKLKKNEETKGEQMNVKDCLLNRLGKIEAELLRKANPQAFDDFVPKHIIPPSGYPSASIIGCMSFAALACRPEEVDHNAQRATYTAVTMLARYGMPTYYVDEKFADAVFQTELPEHLNIEDVKIPMPAMTLVFPFGYLRRRLKAEAWAITIAAAPAGTYPLSVDLTYRHCHCGVIQSEPAFISICQTTTILEVQGAKEPALGYCSYTSHMDPRWPISKAMVELNKMELDVTNSLMADEMIIGMDKVVADEQLVTSSAMFALKLSLAMTAAPQYVESGSLVRKSRFKRGAKVLDDLWSPNVIGSGYRIRVEGLGLGGHHASPRMHWRRGHFRQQSFGPKRSNVKTVWIQPVLVNAGSTSN